MEKPLSNREVAFEVIDTGIGFSKLVKRSATLEGNLPVRALQYCVPVLEGSAAGFQIELIQPMTLARGDGGNIAIDMTPPAFEQTERLAPEALQDLIRRGLISRGSSWMKLLSKSTTPVRGKRLWIWTGLLVRPKAGCWLLVSGAFNRRSRVTVIEHIIADSERWTPLIVEIDGRGLSENSVWLEREIACVMPVAPGMRISKVRLEDSLDDGREFNAFFDASYFREKLAEPTGKYRKLVSHPPPATVAPGDAARVTVASPDVHAWSG